MKENNDHASILGLLLTKNRFWASTKLQTVFKIENVYKIPGFLETKKQT